MYNHIQLLVVMSHTNTICLLKQTKNKYSLTLLDGNMTLLLINLKLK